LPALPDHQQVRFIVNAAPEADLRIASGSRRSVADMVDGVPQVDARNNTYYMAVGNSPGMMKKHLGQGYLDGGSSCGASKTTL
jgi:hypothetical protein